ncbi:hypothetical protein [Streptomyces sp. CB01373]|uniref:hypothetical protein n=1 Tax=Streptomyces sp. CB01373 TaxID=2020325 RepID=UPI000C26E07B|nr:hypothetical protein [Streptomyces sp. CB01373]PJM95910.1 hypothetical protein CG719_09275 [Streptomyces sp. CB01373]
MTAIDLEAVAAAAAPDTLGSYLAESARPAGEQTPGPAPSVRTTEHGGHQITVTTTYDVVVDGTPVTARLYVADSGMLYSPALPYHQFTSALDAVRALMSTYPDHFGGGV